MKRATPLIVFIIFFSPLTTFAQSSSGDLSGSSLFIVLSPQSPAPGEVVNLTVESPLEDLSQSDITWYNNGSVIGEGQGQVTQTIVAPEGGQSATISVSVQNASGAPETAQTSIAPANVDLLVDSDSYAPPFYKGRILPGAESNIHAEAITHFIRADGSVIPPTQINYTWKQDGSVIGSRSGVGKSSITLPAALLFGSTQIEVDAASTDGTLSGSASVSIPTNNPTLVLYENNPVYGFTFYRPIHNTDAIPDLEMTFAAVPYFTTISNPNDPTLDYSWTVNGSSISGSKSDPSELTINAQNSSGQATIGLELYDSQNAFTHATGSWTVTLDAAHANAFESAPSASQNPFTNTNQ
ncbi:MAG TPA: hypothetical protein VMU27_02485 [Candidatus Paceibacterota bacterium]|nr:hypothetical protein [Candidatus Paceibacterota bacterium]